MEAVKKKMNNLKATLEEAEEKAAKAERELKDANEKADLVRWKLLSCDCHRFAPWKP